MPTEEMMLYDYLGDYGIVDGKYTLFHISLRKNLDSILRWGIKAPRGPEEQTFDKFDPARGVYMIAEEIHVPTFLDEYLSHDNLKPDDIVLFRVRLPIVWPVRPDPSSLIMEEVPTAFISDIAIPASALEIVDMSEYGVQT